MLNPYVVPGKPPTTRKSVVALLDVLGFTQRMKAAYLNGDARELLIRLREALDDAYLQFKDKRQHLGFYEEPAASPHNEVLLKDVDGQLFVNYLRGI